MKYAVCWLRLWIGIIMTFCTLIAVIARTEAAPNILSYQGNLYQDGQPVTATKTMGFRIYAEADDPPAEALWNSGDVSVAVTNGAFSVTLGANPQPAFPANLFDSDTRFLSITVDGEEMTERKRLASVPYAINAIPKGGIIMWTGTTAPAGWAICNGENGTPDLRDRFVVGAGATYQVGNAGGSHIHNLSHSHTVNNHQHGITGVGDHAHGIQGEAPGTSGVGDHAHSVNADLYAHIGDTEDGVCGDADDCERESVSSESHGHRLSVNTGGGGGHSHTVHNHSHGGSTGGGGGHNHNGATEGSSPGTNSSLGQIDNRPPYYALCFIMKL